MEKRKLLSSKTDGVLYRESFPRERHEGNRRNGVVTPLIFNLGLWWGEWSVSRPGCYGSIYVSHIGVLSEQSVLRETRAKAKIKPLRASNVPTIEHSTTKGSTAVHEVYTSFALKPKKLSVKKAVEKRVNTVAFLHMTGMCMWYSHN